MNRMQWIKNDLLNRVHSLVLIICMALILGLTGWLIGGVFLAVLAVSLTFSLYFIDPLVSPSFIARMHRGRPLHYHEAARLFQVLEELSHRAGLRVLPRLYYIPGDGMNAFAAGTDENSIITISEGLTGRLSLREIASILAHEISHLRHNDMRILSSANMITQLTNQLSFLGQFLLIFNLPMILLGGYTISWTAILLLIMAPSMNVLLQLGLSRTREYRADLGAAELTGDPESLVSALSKIERYQSRYFRWMFWPPYQRIPEGAFLRTHPPTEKRIEKLLEIRDRGEPADQSITGYPHQTVLRERRARLWNSPSWNKTLTLQKPEGFRAKASRVKL